MGGISTERQPEQIGTHSAAVIQIHKIRTDGGTQSRAEINDEVVADYAEIITGGGDFPPITVYYDGKTYWLADGFHRTAAYRKAGAVEISANVHQGDKRAAILHSVGANASHGLRRTNADKRRAVETLLRDAEWSAWSNNEIAKRCGVSHTFVNGLRSSLETNSSDAPEARTYTTKHGDQATMNTANIGGKNPDDRPAQEKPIDEPESVRSHTGAIPEPSSVDGPEIAAVVRKASSYAALTREAIEDDLAGAHEEIASLRKQAENQAAEIARLKIRIADLSSENQGAAISKLHEQVSVLKKRLDNAQTATKREEYKRKAAEKRVHELEQTPVPL